MARAGGVTLGYLRYVLGLDTLTFKKGMTDAERDLLVMQKRFEKFGSNMASLGNKLTVGLSVPLAAFAAKGISEARETAAAMAQVNAALTSMGPVAGRTGEQLRKASEAFETSSLYEADQVLKDVTANLLTFRNISGTAFDRAQQAAINLSTRLGKDLTSSAIMVGKALNDPLRGMTALGRAGVQFSADQKAAIKAMADTGNIAGAQTIILKELERQFGGAAQAAQNADPWNRATDAFKQMAEAVGTALIPVIDQLVPIVVSIGNAFAALTPEQQKWVVILGATVAAAGPLLSILGNVILVVSNMGPLVGALVKAWTLLNTALAAARIAALATLPALLPFIVPLGLIAAAVGAVYLAWKNWDKIGPMVGRMVSGVQGYLNTLKSILASVLTPITTVTNAFRSMYDKVVGNSYVPDMVDEIGAQMARLDAVLVQPVTKATTAAAEAFRALQEQTAGLLDRLFPEAAALNTFVSELKILEDAMKAGILTANEYAAALQRLKTEGLSDEPIGVQGQGSLVPENDVVFGEIEKASEAMGAVYQTTVDWSKVVKAAAKDIAEITGDWLSRFIEGGAKLKDLWRQLLSYGIQFFTSQGSPFMQAFGGARAAGGPVMSGKAYLVGERGPELFMPSASGKILSNDNTRSAFAGSGVSQTFVFPNSDADSFRRNESQVARAARRAARI